MRLLELLQEVLAVNLGMTWVREMPYSYEGILAEFSVVWHWGGVIIIERSADALVRWGLLWA